MKEKITIATRKQQLARQLCSIIAFIGLVLGVYGMLMFSQLGLLVALIGFGMAGIAEQKQKDIKLFKIENYEGNKSK